MLDRARQGALLREGITVVLAGQPNVGKSSLLNALAGAELAIVTPIAGTTRDKVSETLQIRGVPLHVIDTAGLREAGDEVERIGVARSWEAIGQADAVLFLHDLTRLGQPDYDGAEAEIAARLAADMPARLRVVDIYNKCDAAPAAAAALEPGALRLSARSGEGLEALRERLLVLAGWHADTGGTEGLFIARARHVHALQRAGSHLAQAQDWAAQRDGALDLLAEELRLAHLALGEITGSFSVG